MLGWCYANGVDQASIEANVTQQIADQVNPPVIAPPLPWLPPVEIVPPLVEQIIEVKPHAQTKPPKVLSKPNRRYITEVQTWGINSAKWDAARRYCDSKNMDFVIITEHELGLKF